MNPHTGEVEDRWSCDVCRYAIYCVVDHCFYYYIAGLRVILSMHHSSGVASQLVALILLGILYALFLDS
jgi:hypothetical protein